MAQKVYKSPLDMSKEEWDDVVGQATAHTDFTQPQQVSMRRVNFTNKDDFLRRNGMDKFYEFDGGDLWDITDDDSHMTTIRVGYGEPSWDEDKLIEEIEKLGKWKRPDPAVQKLKAAGWTDDRIAAAEQGIKEKHPDDATIFNDWKLKNKLPEGLFHDSIQSWDDLVSRMEDANHPREGIINYIMKTFGDWRK